jgi:hypothetical protein
MADKQLPTRDTAIAVRPESIPTPEGKTERRELRSVSSKTFLHAETTHDGKEIRTCHAPLGDVCYHDDNGELRSIDTTVRDIDGVIGVEWAPYRMHLHGTGIGFDFESRAGGKCSIALTGIGGEKFDTEATLKPDITDNVITFQGVRPGCDIVFKCLNERVKTLRILRDADAPKTFEWRCESDKPELIDSTLTGTDAAGNRLELSSEVDGDVIRETWTGNIKVRLDAATRIKSLSDAVAYPVEIDPTVTASPTAGADDGYEAENVPAWNSSNIYVGCYHAYGVEKMNAGILFRNVTVPQGATVTSATLDVNVSARTGSGGAGTIYARSAANPGVFNSSNRPSGVSKTAASVVHSAPSGTGLQSYVITAIIQEKVSDVAWVSGNAIGIPIVTSTSGVRSFHKLSNYESGSNIPSISITYTAAASGGTVPRRRSSIRSLLTR